MIEVANASAAELRELEARIAYEEARTATRAATARVEQVQAGITAVESRRQKAAVERREIFDTGLNQALRGTDITTDLARVATLDAAITLYTKSTAQLIAINLQDALVDQTGAALREAQALYTYEASRRAAQEERILEGAAKIPTAGVPFVLDTALLLESWTMNVVRAERIREDAERNHKNALAERLAKRAQYAQKYTEEQS